MTAKWTNAPMLAATNKHLPSFLPTYLACFGSNDGVWQYEPTVQQPAALKLSAAEDAAQGRRAIPVMRCAYILCLCLPHFKFVRICAIMYITWLHRVRGWVSTLHTCRPKLGKFVDLIHRFLLSKKNIWVKWTSFKPETPFGLGVFSDCCWPPASGSLSCHVCVI